MVKKPVTSLKTKQKTDFACSSMDFVAHSEELSYFVQNQWQASNPAARRKSGRTEFAVPARLLNQKGAT